MRIIDVLNIVLIIADIFKTTAQTSYLIQQDVFLPKTIKHDLLPQRESFKMDSVVLRYPLPLLEEKFDSLNQGKRRSVFTIKTLHGFEFSEASSALQKSIRRGHWKDALQWAVEMSMVPIAGKSNAWNRLFVVSVEDVGPADVKQFMIVKALYELYLEDKDNPLYAVTAAVSLAKAKKTRVSDWAIHVYKFSQSDVKDENVEDLVEDLVDNFFDKKLWKTLYASAKLMATSGKVKIKGIRVTIPIKVAIVKIQKELEYLIQDENKKNYMRCIMKRAINKITGPNKNKKNPCRGGEGILFFVHFINVWMFDVEYGFDVDIKPDESLLPLIDKVIEGDIHGIPDYALDIHTRRGKKMKRDFDHFNKVGALLINEDEKWKAYSKFCFDKLIDRLDGVEMLESYDSEFVNAK
uniref:Uncharacterized protein n=1 Tax=Pithovirus LCPAC404 TaxID=2506597 RepID=A0A481ZBP0_9VIRU|nr:MAG: uncharacterized protein LCPAC404_00570 [Pithovirus LCPAC404]